MQQIIQKPWGTEVVLTQENSPYTLKILNINKNQRLSLQYHDIKLETLSIIKGDVQIVWGEDKDNLKTETMLPNTGYTIKPNTIHRFIALSDSVLVEASTTEKGITFRLEDDYARPDETEILRSQPNRGYQVKSNNGQ